MRAEPTYLEKVESYLVDEFHHGLHRIMLETLWSDVRVGAWSDDLKFFKCLDAEYQYLLATRTKPLQVQMHLQNLNFSCQETVSGLIPKNSYSSQWLRGNTIEDVMQEKIRAVVNEGRIEPVEEFDVPDGTQVLITVLSNGEDFWLNASEGSLNAIWDNPEDDVYAELLKG